MVDNDGSIELMVIAALIVFGLIFGSFVNALVWRLRNHRDLATERSECSNCHHVLGWKDLIPIFSWLYLGGKCRYCHKPIEDSPLVELALALLFVLSYIFWPVTLTGAGLFSFVVWLVFLVGFLALTVYDLRWFLLPNKIVFPLIGLASLQVLVVWLGFYRSWSGLLWALLAAVILSGLFYLLFQVSAGKWIGGGDVKLAIVLGLLAGTPLKALLLLFIASLAGTLVAMPTLFKRHNRRLLIPFGPFLIFGLIITELFGNAIIAWYVSFL